MRLSDTFAFFHVRGEKEEERRRRRRNRIDFFGVAPVFLSLFLSFSWGCLSLSPPLVWWRKKTRGRGRGRGRFTGQKTIIQIPAPSSHREGRAQAQTDRQTLVHTCMHTATPCLPIHQGAWQNYWDSSSPPTLFYSWMAIVCVERLRLRKGRRNNDPTGWRWQPSFSTNDSRFVSEFFMR